MKLLVRFIILSVIAMPLPVHAGVIDLTTAYQKAVDYDARLRSAQADNLINKEEIGKARSQFLPSSRLNAARGRSATQHGYLGRYYPADFYNTINYGVSFRQPLFNLSTLASYRQAKHEAVKSEFDLQREETNLIVRITEAYCNALYAEDNLEFSKALITAMQAQLQQAKGRFEKGFGTITEIKEAQAGYDMALADAVEMANGVEFSRRELENIAGVYPDQLCRVVPEKLQLVRLQPGKVEAWIEFAHASNPAILAARQEIIIAKREIDKQKFSRYPTIDLVAGRNYSESENNYSIGSTYDTYSISLQMSVPLYSGGYISASIRQAHAKWLKAGEQLHWLERGIDSDVRKYYNGVLSSIAQVKAYEQAVNSHEIALKGTIKGYEAGLRSNVDVLDAQQKLFESSRNLAKSRYQYIINRFMLKQASGTLTPADIDEVNGWLARAKP